MAQPYWKEALDYQFPIGQGHRDDVHGHWPSVEDDEDVDIVHHDAAAPTAPQPQTAAETMTPKEDDKKTEQPFDVDDPDSARKWTPAAEKPEDAKKPDVKKPEDESKR